MCISIKLNINKIREYFDNKWLSRTENNKQLRIDFITSNILQLSVSQENYMVEREQKLV